MMLKELACFGSREGSAFPLLQGSAQNGWHHPRLVLLQGISSAVKQAAAERQTWRWCCVASLPLHCSGPASARFAPSGLSACYRLVVHSLHAGEAC
jgi:hypothetical protein